MYNKKYIFQVFLFLMRKIKKIEYFMNRILIDNLIISR